MTAFRFPGGSSLVRSSASAASRAATSRSPFFAWNNSLVMSSAARIAALCVSTMGPCDNTFLSAWSTYAATSRVYSGGRSERTVYSSPPIITLTACFFVLTEPRRSSQRHRIRPRAVPPPAPSAVPGLARLLFQEGQPAEQVVHAELRRLHPLAQGLVFLLEVRQPVAHLGIEPRRPTACRAPELLDVRLGLERARAPAGQLFRDRAKDRLQLVHDRRISPLSVVPQARPPATAAPARAPVPLPVPAACERDRGTCSATPHCGARSGSRAPDTRQRPRRARAG